MINLFKNHDAINVAIIIVNIKNVIIPVYIYTKTLNLKLILFLNLLAYKLDA